MPAPLTDAEALAYIASYPDLRTILGVNAEAGRQHYEAFGRAEGRTISFSSVFYTAANPDLIRAFGTDGVAATQHFIRYGATEGRPTQFDALTYIASHPDLTQAFGADAAAGAQHYIRFGFSEQRATAGFDALGYIASYPDLIEALGTDTRAAAEHYLRYGLAEHRTVGFSALEYIASYPDLIQALGTDMAAATRHYVQFGYAEHRATAAFDPVAYLLSQPDLRAAGIGAEGALRHWITYGFAEGRSDSTVFGREQADHQLLSRETLTARIDGAGDQDWFMIDAKTGDTVQVTMTLTQAEGPDTPIVHVYDSSGRELDVTITTAGSGTARLAFAAATSGPIYVTAAATGAYAGAYTVEQTLEAAPDRITINGTDGDDILTGTDRNEDIFGGNGFDTLNGGAGDDVLDGGNGSDSLNGGSGDDILYGNRFGSGAGDVDTLTDDQGGNDQLFGGAGDDNLLVYRSGNMAASTVSLSGGDGNDLILFSSSRHLDTVTIFGGRGNDTIDVGGVLRSTIDAGAGDDRVTIAVTGGSQTITLGAGADVLTLGSVFDPVALGTETHVTDFAPGTDSLDFDKFLSNAVQGWDPATNPFAGGFVRLLQSGADTLLQIDRDGGGDGFATLLTFDNTTAAAFTARDLGHAPDGSAGVALTLTGTSGGDILRGAAGNDTLQGLLGNDTLEGGAGNDLLEGGDGYDRLNGGAGNDTLYGNNAGDTGGDVSGDYLLDDQGGNDQLFGQGGDDTVRVYRYGNIAASSVLLDGGAGNDFLYFSSERHLDTVTVRGGPGNDQIYVYGILQADIDAGDSNDQVTIVLTGGTQTITLGQGNDTLILSDFYDYYTVGSSTRVTDFAVGTDTLDIVPFLKRTLVGWDGASDVFAGGYVKLVQSGADTLLQLDIDGGGNALSTVLTFDKVKVADLASELGRGFASAQHGASGDLTTVLGNLDAADDSPATWTPWTDLPQDPGHDMVAASGFGGFAGPLLHGEVLL